MLDALVIVQDSRTRMLARLQSGHAGDDGRDERITPGLVPAQHRTQHRQHQVGSARARVARDLVEHGHDLAAFQLRYRTRAEVGEDPSQNAPVQLARPLRAAEVEISLADRRERALGRSDGSLLLRLLLVDGVYALRDEEHRIGGELAGGRERQTGRQGHLPRHAAGGMTIANDEAPGPSWSDREAEPALAPVRYLAGLLRIDDREVGQCST